MQDYYEKSMRALQLAGLNKRTQECDTRSVRQLIDHFGKTPDKITEEDIEAYVEAIQSLPLCRPSQPPDRTS